MENIYHHSFSLIIQKSCDMKADDMKSLLSNPNYYLQKNLNHFVKKG